MLETTHLSYQDGMVNITLSTDSLSEIAAPGVHFEDPELLVEACFTPKELDNITLGAKADLSFSFTLADIPEDNAVKEQLLIAKESEEATLGRLYEGVYLDMDAYKSFQEETSEQISSLSSEVMLTIDIPLYLISEDRSYWVMVDHKGECFLLPDLDKEPNTITIAAHNLGQSVILYQDPLDSLSDSTDEAFHLNSKHVFLAGIICLAALWLFVDRLHKKSV